MLCRLACVFLLVVCQLWVRADEDVDGFFKLMVEHSFDKDGSGESFSRRGTITINSLKSGKGDMYHDAQLSDDDIKALRKLAEADGIYRIRVAKLSSTDSSPSYVYSFIKACSLLESGLSDKITVYLDTYGSLLGVSIGSDVPYCSPDSHKSFLSDGSSFNTAVEIQQPSVGPAPETDLFIKKLEQEKQQAKGQQVDNRSFFAKYWMYIIPVFIFLMVFNADPNAGQSGGGGR